MKTLILTITLILLTPQALVSHMQELEHNLIILKERCSKKYPIARIAVEIGTNHCPIVWLNGAEDLD